MPADALLVSAFALSLIVVLAVTPVAIRIADRTGFHDRPIGYKGHSKPTPYLGGSAVFSGYVVGALLVGATGSRLVWVVLLALALWGVGTWDDRYTVSPLMRVVAEAGAACALFAAGLGWSITGDTAVDLAISVLWVVALANAFNLMDNMDGAACTVALCSSLGAAVIALVVSDRLLAGLALALGGACLGFLRYNLAGPARIFLGDGGSMPIGFVVSATIMALPLGGHLGWRGLAIGILLAGLPLLDTALVILSRYRAGISLLQGGRDHLTHRLRSRLPSVGAVVAALGASQATLCALALWLSRHGGTATALAWALLLCAGALAVAVLESRAWAPARPLTRPGAQSAAHAALDMRAAPAAARSPAEASPPADETPARRARRDRPGDGVTGRGGLLRIYPLEVGLVVLVAASCGLSPFFYGFYGLRTWGPIALGLLAVLFGLVVGRPALPRREGVVAVAGLSGLALWALVSTGWAGSAGNALLEADRWMLYATLLAILLLLLRDDRLARLLIVVSTGFVLLLAAYVLVRMLGGDTGLFSGKRLNAPLGYVNGQATYFLLGLWPLIALGERTTRPWIAGTAIGSATVLSSLVLLSETRAIVPAIAVSAFVMIVLVPGRARRGWALALVLAGLAAVAPAALHVYDSAGSATIRTTAIAMLAAGACTALVWTLATAASNRFGTAARRKLSAALLVAVVAVTCATVLATVHDPVSAISRQASEFTQLRSATGQDNRFLFGGGNRYDYWRIAIDEFKTEPLRGVGAGSYQFDYFRERRTAEDIRQPHSLELQALSELGLIGLSLVLAFAGAVLVGLHRRARRARKQAPDSGAGLTVAAGGMFVIWLVHTSIDWIHLIPGVTGTALAAAAVLLGPWRGPATGTRSRRYKLAVVACAGVVVAAAVFLGRATLADRYSARAEGELSRAPTRALADANRSLALNGDHVPTHYLRSAAYARLHDYQGARLSLLDALRLEPRNFVTWALLGDLAVRHGDLSLARNDYRAALRLNPRDPELPALVRDPAGPPSS